MGHHAHWSSSTHCASVQCAFRIVSGTIKEAVAIFPRVCGYPFWTPHMKWKFTIFRCSGRKSDTRAPWCQISLLHGWFGIVLRFTFARYYVNARLYDISLSCESSPSDSVLKILACELHSRNIGVRVFIFARTSVMDKVGRVLATARQEPKNGTIIVNVPAHQKIAAGNSSYQVAQATQSSPIKCAHAHRALINCLNTGRDCTRTVRTSWTLP